MAEVIWEPKTCPKDDGEMASIPGMDEAWKCSVCGLEIWGGDIPTAEEYEELMTDKMVLQSASYKPYVSRSFVQLPQKSGGSKTGRSRKGRRKVDLQNKYRMILTDKK